MNVNPRDLNVKELQKQLLEEFGVSLGDAERLKSLGLA